MRLIWTFPRPIGEKMENKKFKPLFDKLFWLSWIPLSVMLIVGTVIAATAPMALIIMLATDIFTAYFLISSTVGYVELRENSVFVKCGFILKRDIPYSSIRGLTEERKIYSESMISIKNALDHVNIKYGKFDVITVSVKGSDDLIREILARTEAHKAHSS